MTNRLFLILAALILLAGAVLGFLLSWQPAIKPYKLLFVIGSYYNLLAVVVLSEAVTPVKRYKEVSVKFIAPLVLWIHTLVPIGAVIGAYLAKLVFGAVGGEKFLHFFWGLFAYSLIPLFLFDSMVVFPRRKVFADLESRWRFLGLFLVCSGVLLQLIASVFDVVG